MTTQIVTTEYDIERVPAPNLPLAPAQYDPRYHEALNNILRLYFNRLDNFIARLGSSPSALGFGAFRMGAATTLTADIGNGTTTPISVTSTEGFPGAGFILIGNEAIVYLNKTATQFGAGGGIFRGVLGTTTAAHLSGTPVTEVWGTQSPTVIALVLFNGTDFSNDVYISNSDNSRIYFNNTGVYNIQFSAQFLNFTNVEDNVTMWFARNGVDIPNSASLQQVNSKHGGEPGAAILTVNIFEEFTAGDYVSLKWASDTGNTALATYPAGTSPTHPVVPAVILTVNFVGSVTP